MAQIKLVWTRLAIQDLNAAYDYISAENPAAAEGIINRVEQALEALKRHPEIGRPGRISTTRELVVTQTPFIIPYRVNEDRIEVLAFLHSARKWPDKV